VFFLEKSEESRPPLKLKNDGGLLSGIFSKNHYKCLKMAISIKFSDFRKRPVAQKQRGK